MDEIWLLIFMTEYEYCEILRVILKLVDRVCGQILLLKLRWFSYSPVIYGSSSGLRCKISNLITSRSSPKGDLIDSNFFLLKF